MGPLPWYLIHLNWYLVLVRLFFFLVGGSWFVLWEPWDKGPCQQLLTLLTLKSAIEKNPYWAVVSDCKLCIKIFRVPSPTLPSASELLTSNKRNGEKLFDVSKITFAHDTSKRRNASLTSSKSIIVWHLWCDRQISDALHKMFVHPKTIKMHFWSPSNICKLFVCP